MGKGDKRSKKGKIIAGSFGKSRLTKKNRRQQDAPTKNQTPAE